MRIMIFLNYSNFKGNSIVLDSLSSIFQCAFLGASINSIDHSKYKTSLHGVLPRLEWYTLKVTKHKHTIHFMLDIIGFCIIWLFLFKNLMKLTCTQQPSTTNANQMSSPVMMIMRFHSLSSTTLPGVAWLKGFMLYINLASDHHKMSSVYKKSYGIW